MQLHLYWLQKSLQEQWESWGEVTGSCKKKMNAVVHRVSWWKLIRVSGRLRWSKTTTQWWYTMMSFLWVIFTLQSTENVSAMRQRRDFWQNRWLCSLTGLFFPSSLCHSCQLISDYGNAFHLPLCISLPLVFYTSFFLSVALDDCNFALCFRAIIARDKAVMWVTEHPVSSTCGREGEQTRFYYILSAPCCGFSPVSRVVFCCLLRSRHRMSLPVCQCQRAAGIGFSWVTLQRWSGGDTLCSFPDDQSKMLNKVTNTNIVLQTNSSWQLQNKYVQR